MKYFSLASLIAIIALILGGIKVYQSRVEPVQTTSPEHIADPSIITAEEKVVMQFMEGVMYLRTDTPSAQAQMLILDAVSSPLENSLGNDPATFRSGVLQILEIAEIPDQAFQVHSPTDEQGTRRFLVDLLYSSGTVRQRGVTIKNTQEPMEIVQIEVLPDLASTSAIVPSTPTDGQL